MKEDETKVTTLCFVTRLSTYEAQLVELFFHTLGGVWVWSTLTSVTPGLNGGLHSGLIHTPSTYFHCQHEWMQSETNKYIFKCRNYVMVTDYKLLP